MRDNATTELSHVPKVHAGAIGGWWVGSKLCMWLAESMELKPKPKAEIWNVVSANGVWSDPCRTSLSPLAFLRR